METRVLRWWLAALGLTVTTGCPFALAAPPVELRVAGGGALNRSVEPLPKVDVQATLRPVSVIESQNDRQWDVGVGYAWLPALEEGQTLLQGPHVQADWFFWERANGRTRLRLSAGARGRVLRDAGYFGAGGSLYTAGEIIGWADGAGADCGSSADGLTCAAGAAWGEGGVGAFVEGGYLRAGSEDLVTLQAGLSVRIPASAAVGFLFFWEMLNWFD